MNNTATFGLDRSPRLPDYDIKGEDVFGSHTGPEHFKMEDVDSYQQHQQQQERMQCDPQDHLFLLPSPPPSANHAKLLPSSYDGISAHDYSSSIGTTSAQHVEGRAFLTNDRAFPVLSPNVMGSIPAGLMISPALSTTESDTSLLTTPRDGIALEQSGGNTKTLINTGSRGMNVGDMSQSTLKGVSKTGIGGEGSDRESWFAAEQDKFLKTENFFERYTDIPSPPHTADINPFYPPYAYERMAPYEEDRASFEASGGGGEGGSGGDPIKPVTRLHSYQQPSVGIAPMTRLTTPPRASTVRHDNCESLAAETTSYGRRRRKATYRGQDAVPESHQNEFIGNPLLSRADNMSKSIDRRNTFNMSGVLVHEEDLAILEQPNPVLPQFGRSVDHPLAHYSHQEELLSAPQSSSPTSMKGLGMRLRSSLGSVTGDSLVQGFTNQQSHQHQQHHHQPQRNMSYHSGMVPTPLSGSYLRSVPLRVASPYDAMPRRYSHAVDTMSLYPEDHDTRPVAKIGAMMNYSTELVGSNVPLSTPFGSTLSRGSLSSNLKEPVELSNRKTAHGGMGFVMAEPFPRSRSAPASPDLGTVASHGMTFSSSYMPYANVSLPLFVVTPGITSEHHQSTLDSSGDLNWKRVPRHEQPHPCAREMTHLDDGRNGRGNVRRRTSTSSTWGGPATISAEPTSSYIMTADDHESGTSFGNECSATTITTTSSSAMIASTSTSLSNGVNHQSQKSLPPSSAAVRLLQQRRSSKVLPPPHAGFAFVNFTASDAKTLSNGVAPSGSSKRKREEEEQHQHERESKIVVVASTTPATPPPPKSTIKKEDGNMTGDQDNVLTT